VAPRRNGGTARAPPRSNRTWSAGGSARPELLHARALERSPTCPRCRRVWDADDCHARASPDTFSPPCAVTFACTLTRSGSARTPAFRSAARPCVLARALAALRGRACSLELDPRAPNGGAMGTTGGRPSRPRALCALAAVRDCARALEPALTAARTRARALKPALAVVRDRARIRARTVEPTRTTGGRLLCPCTPCALAVPAHHLCAHRRAQSRPCQCPRSRARRAQRLVVWPRARRRARARARRCARSRSRPRRCSRARRARRLAAGLCARMCARCRARPHAARCRPRVRTRACRCAR
jgi:hypothetical protein